jgi:hypothetical protein
MIHLVEQPIKPIPILLATLGEPDPLLFYNNSRVMVGFTSKYALEFCQHGIIDGYLKNPILTNSSRMDKLIFYSIDGERHPEQMCWLWTLHILKCLVIYGDSKGYVVNEIMKFVSLYRQRIFSIISVPSVLVSKQISTLSYAFLEELETTLQLL